MFRQARVVCCIFYSLEDINLFIDKFGFADFEYAYIYHDNDKNKDGTDKEPHYHFYGRRKSPITEQSLKNFAKSCQQNYFYENLKSNDNALLVYFTHAECNDKYQYPLSDIVANFDIQLRINQPCINDKVDPSIIISLFDEGLTTVDIIKRFPKLIYSVSNLHKYEKLLRFQVRQKQISRELQELSKTEYSRVLSPLTMAQVSTDDLPF